MRIELVDQPDEPLRQAIQAPLRAYNEQRGGPSGHRALAISLHDDAGRIVGGLWGATAYGWLYTQLLVVPPDQHGKGLGTRLMAAAEDAARTRGCHHAWVDTIFGARGFYERLGYRVFGELADHPPGFTRSFLTKALNP